MEPRENEREVRLNALGIRRIAGMLLGAGAGVLILFIGFWRTALIAACAALGWWIGGGCYIPNLLLHAIGKLLSRRGKSA